MFLARDLPTVTIRDLSRSPGEVLQRVLRGERLIVSRHGHPIATLQPLNGCVTQPFEGKHYDVVGSPLVDVDHEIAKLRPAEKRILMDGVRGDRIYLMRLRGGDSTEALRLFPDWQLRGLARKTKRGIVITGLAMLLRERLLEKAGLSKRLYD